MRLATSSSWMLTRLALATTAEQEQAARDRLALFQPPTHAAYRRYLAWIGHFEFAVEAALVRVMAVPAGLLHRVIKSGYCTEDTTWLGPDDAVTFELAARPDVVPRLGSLDEAIGWMYMLERNRATADEILESVRIHLPRAYIAASRYLRACIDRYQERWWELGISLDRSAGNGDAVVAAARDAFARHRSWYAAEHPRPSDAITTIQRPR
jgi:heme oxygenase